ncbi:MAG: tyrosine-type recombinase/integrase [Chthoniobacterales bacterium]|nr:tyrosine-type recombinase/integrase [Chthoniobacterales bacterium]
MLRPSDRDPADCLAVICFRHSGRGRHLESRGRPRRARRAWPRPRDGPSEKSLLWNLVWLIRHRGHDHALKDAGLPSGIRLHDLRHTAATLWLAAGESIYFVQQQLGHADIQTTIDQYRHPDKQAHREAAARAAEWWREAASE